MKYTFNNKTDFNNYCELRINESKDIIKKYIDELESLNCKT